MLVCSGTLSRRRPLGTSERMSNHYGDFHIVETGDGVEINDVRDGKWVVIPHETWREIVDAYAEHYAHNDEADPARP